MKDGIADKLSALVNELEKEGFLCGVIGVDAAALDKICCDMHRLITVQQLSNAIALSVMTKYSKYVERRNAQHH